MLKDDDIMFLAQPLLPFDIDQKVGIVAIEVIDGDLVKALNRGQQSAVDFRLRPGRMSKIDQDFIHYPLATTGTSHNI